MGILSFIKKIAGSAKGLDDQGKVDSTESPIFKAIRLRDLKMLSGLIDSGQSISQKNPQGETPLINAIANDFEDGVITLINEDTIRQKNRKRQSPSELMIEKDMITAFEMAIETEFKLNSKIKKNSDCYEAALASGNEKIISIILKGLSQIKGGDYRKKYPLHWAAANERAELVQAWVKAGWDINLRDDKNYSPIRYAVEAGRLKSVSCLAQMGADLHCTYENNETLIHRSYLPCKIKEMIELLVNKLNLDINQRDRNGKTPLATVLEEDHCCYDGAGIYIDAGADIKAKDHAGNGLLHFARSLNDCRILLANGADPSAQNNLGELPYETAMKNKAPVKVINLLFRSQQLKDQHAEIVDAIRSGDEESALEAIKTGALVDGSDENGVTPLIAATARDMDRVVKALLDSKACPALIANALPDERGPWDDLNCYNKPVPFKTYNIEEGLTAVHLACASGNSRIAALLAPYVADLDNETYSDKVPMNMAIANNHWEVVKILIEGGTDLTKTSRSPLKEAVSKGFRDIVKLLLDNGCTLEVSTTYSHKNILCYAAEYSRYDLGLLFHKMGLKSNSPQFNEHLYPVYSNKFDTVINYHRWIKTEDLPFNGEGRTALHIAAISGATDLALKLASMDQVDIDSKEFLYGATVLHLAVITGNYETAEKLIDAGADKNLLTDSGKSIEDIKELLASDNETALLIQKCEKAMVRLMKEFLTNSDSCCDDSDIKNMIIPVENNMFKVIEEIRKLSF